MQEPKPAPIGKGLRPPGEDPEEDDEEKLEAPSPPSKVQFEDESNVNKEVLGGTEEQWAAVDAAAEKKLQEQAARREAAEAKKVLHKGKMTGAADKFESFARTQLKIPNDQVTAYFIALRASAAVPLLNARARRLVRGSRGQAAAWGFAARGGHAAGTRPHSGPPAPLKKSRRIEVQYFITSPSFIVMAT